MNVIITGASKGIGNALARQFSKYRDIQLYLIARSEDKLIKLKNECEKLNPDVKIIPIAYDLVSILKESLPKEIDCEHIDILINNAGFLIRKDFQELSTEEIIGMTTVNYIAPTLLIQKLLDKLGGENPSHIINISSMAGFQGSTKFPGLSIYSSGKAALASLTECLASEFSKKNIYINSLALGAVQTDMLSKAFPDLKAKLTPDEMAQFIADFSLNGYKYFHGRILPVSFSTP